MTVVDTVLVKLASRCNLDCGYCYVYSMGDGGWKAQPKRMSLEVATDVARRLAELRAVQDADFSVVFHGGEPLLAGRARFAEVCDLLRAALPRTCGLHLQTNGLLLDDAALDVCARNEVGVSISFDGPSGVHDAHRPDRAGRGTRRRVLDAIGRLRAHPAAATLFTGILAVVDPRSDPLEVYEELKATGAPSIDFLYRDGNHDELPFGKSAARSTEYGEWMRRVLEIYLADRRPVPVRVLDDMLKLLLGGTSRKEGVGTAAYGILVVETDGGVGKNDTLKSAFDGADRFETGWNVADHALADVVASREFALHQEEQKPCSPLCLSCPDLGICGGGMPAHRWGRGDGYRNPSVFCADQKLLVEAMRGHLSRSGAAP